MYAKDRLGNRPSRWHQMAWAGSAPPRSAGSARIVTCWKPSLPRATILLVEVGSTADGTGLAGGEDQDELGVVVESPASVLGLNEAGFRTVMQRTQPEGSRSGPGDTDRTLYSLRRFLRLRHQETHQS